MTVPEKILEIEDLVVEFAGGRGPFGRTAPGVLAVNGVTLSLQQGETLGLVGESGSGKSTLGKAILRLVSASAGSIRMKGVDLLRLRGEELRKMRTRMQMVFQDPNASLNPRMKVIEIVGDGLLIHGLAKRNELETKVGAILEQVGLGRDDLYKYPHQFSGGQKQRIGIARALILEPDFLVLDEPVSALDVSIQAQIINLLKELKARRNLTFLFIAHDIGVVANVSDRIAVMYLGRIMEVGSDIVAHPRHPYTQALLRAIPSLDPSKAGRRESLSGDPPSPAAPPSGCVFRTRCPLAESVCSERAPILENGTACHVVNRK